MLLAVVLATALLGVYCDSKCYFEINKLRCWCRENSGQTLFRISHNQVENSSWSVTLEPVDENCRPEDVMNVLPDEWFDRNIENTTEDQDGGLYPEMLDKGYQIIGDSYLKLHTNGTYWDNARRTCISEGAHLAVINSQKEAQHLALLLRNNSYLITHAVNNKSVFIGFHDIFEEGEYLTVFGEPLDNTGFYDWAPNKPDNRGILLVGTSGNDCGGLFETGTLTDLGCDWNYAFICERENRDTSCESYVDYSKGSYKGVEMEAPPGDKTRPRTTAGLGYILYPEIGFYRYVTTPVTWDNARLWCAREGAFLSTANSRVELELLTDIHLAVDRYFIPGRWENPCVFIGFHSYYQQSEFVTIHNESIDYDNFLPDEPNNEFGSEHYSGENCGVLAPEGKLNDIDCNFKMPFFCEKSLQIP